MRTVCMAANYSERLLPSCHTTAPKGVLAFRALPPSAQLGYPVRGAPDHPDMYLPYQPRRRQCTAVNANVPSGVARSSPPMAASMAQRKVECVVVKVGLLVKPK